MIWYNPKSGARRWAPPGMTREGRRQGRSGMAGQAGRAPQQGGSRGVAPSADELVNPMPGTVSFMLALLLLGLDAALLTLLHFFPPAGGLHKVQAFATLIGQINVYLLFAGFLGLVLGIMGLAEQGCKKVLSTWGAVLNGALFWGLLTFFVVSWR
jgi:hypothetical protein